MTIDQQFSDFTARLCAFIRRTSTAAGSSGGIPDGTDEEFNTLALELFALQFAANPAYKKLCRFKNFTTASIGNWWEIPVVPTVAFKELELTSLPPGERATVFHSSGTTHHKPSRHFHSAESFGLYAASLLPWFKARLLSDRDDTREPITLRRTTALQMICLTPSPDLAPHSSLVHMLTTLSGEFGDSDSFFAGAVDSSGAWVISFDRLMSSLQEAQATRRPVAILGTAFNFVHLLDDLVARDLRYCLPSGSRVMETGGYKGRSRSIPKAQLHRLITERLGVPAERIVCEYGMSELSSQAYDLAIPITLHASRFTLHASRIFHFPPWARVQIVSPETGHEVAEGEAGLIRVFDLANVRSVLAIQTEDLGVRRGNGFELIGRAATAEARGCSLMNV